MTTFVAFSNTMLNTNSGYGGQTPGCDVREVIPVASLNSVYSGPVQASIIIKSQTGTSGTLAGAYIGSSGGGTNNVNFQGDQAQVKWSGSASLALSGAQTYTASDLTAIFNYDPTKPLVISLFFTGTTCTAASATTSLGANTNNYQLNAANQTSVTAPTGAYTGDTFFSWVMEVDLTEMPAAVEYGAGLNISSVTANSFRDLFIPPLNLSLYAPPPAASPFFGLASPAPFNTLAYRDSQFDSNAFLPSIIQGAIQSYLGGPFNDLSYRDRFFDGAAILPNIVQCAVQSTFGAPFDSKIYLDRLFDSSAFLPNIIQGQIQSNLGAPFNPANYRDPPNTGRGPHPFLPNTIQGPVQSNLGTPFNAWSYRDSFVAPLNVGLYPPSVVANPFSLPLPAIPFNTLSYRDSYLPSANANLFPPAVPAFFAASFPIPFNSGSYRDSFLKSNAFLPNIIQGEVGSYLGGQFNPQSYRDTFFDGNAFLPNTIQGQVSAYLGAPFSALSYRDNSFDANAFLPTVLQAPSTPFFNISPAAFNPQSYRDYSIPLRNVNLYPPPFGTPFASFIEQNAAPFNPQSYFDRYVFERLPELFPPPSGTPFVNPYPRVPFDAKWYTDTSADLKSAFLPSIIQGQVQAYFGAPFNAGSYRDARISINAFLPSTIQGEVAAYFGAPFNSGSYKDSYVFDRSTGLYQPSAPPFVNQPPFVPFDSRRYNDTSEFQPFQPRVTQPSVGYQLGAPFDSKGYRDSAKYPPNPFLPRAIQGPVSSTLGAPFRPLSYRDTFVIVPNPTFYPPRTVGFPFFNPWLTVPFDVHGYQEEVWCPRAAVNIVSLCVGQDQTIRIAIQDAFGNWLQPPFDLGWFDVSLNGQNVFERNTNSAYARIISFVTGQWYLEVNIRKSDTQHIPIGWYNYSAFLGDTEIEAGLLQMSDCSIPVPVKRNYPVEPLPLSAGVPFSNPMPSVKFNPLRYIDAMAGFNFFAR